MYSPDCSYRSQKSMDLVNMCFEEESTKEVVFKLPLLLWGFFCWLESREMEKKWSVPKLFFSSWIIDCLYRMLPCLWQLLDRSRTHNLVQTESGSSFYQKLWPSPRPPPFVVRTTKTTTNFLTSRLGVMSDCIANDHQRNRIKTIFKDC